MSQGKEWWQNMGYGNIPSPLLQSWCIPGAHPAFLLWNPLQGSCARGRSPALVPDQRAAHWSCSILLPFPELGQGTDSGKLKANFWGNLTENDCWKVTCTHYAPKESMRLLPQTGICFINEYSIFLKLASEQLKTSASLFSAPLQSFTWIIGGQGL